MGYIALRALYGSPFNNIVTNPISNKNKVGITILSLYYKFIDDARSYWYLVWFGFDYFRVRRAEWKWAVERAAVASRWTWLQAQVSDLEYRIRQQSDIYKQIRLAKGPVNLGDPPTPQDLLQHVHRNSIETRIPVSAASLPSSGTEVSPCNVSAVMSNVDRQASRLTQSLGNCLSPATLSPTSSMSSSRPRSTVSSPPLTQNGFVESPFSTSGGETDTAESSPLGQSSDQHLSAAVVDLSPVLDPTCRAARCLPLKHPLRKRKLLRTSGLHLMSRKAARLSTIKCHCHHPVMPCVVCSGRVNNMQPLEPDYMPFRERVALLDSSYHHVLSFPEGKFFYEKCSSICGFLLIIRSRAEVFMYGSSMFYLKYRNVIFFFPCDFCRLATFCSQS